MLNPFRNLTSKTPQRFVTKIQTTKNTRANRKILLSPDRKLQESKISQSSKMTVVKSQYPNTNTIKKTWTKNLTSSYLSQGISFRPRFEDPAVYTMAFTPAALSLYPSGHLFGSTKPDRVVSEFKELPSISNLRMPKNKQKHSKKEHTLHSFAEISYQGSAIVLNFSHHNVECEHSKFLHNWEAPDQRNSARFPWFSQFCHSIGTF